MDYKNIDYKDLTEYVSNFVGRHLFLQRVNMVWEEIDLKRCQVHSPGFQVGTLIRMIVGKKNIVSNSPNAVTCKTKRGEIRVKFVQHSPVFMDITKNEVSEATMDLVSPDDIAHALALALVAFEVVEYDHHYSGAEAQDYSQSDADTADETTIGLIPEEK